MSAIVAAKKLVSNGWNEWTGGKHHRVYCNDVAGLISLELDQYNTGNISSAQLDGEKLANSRAREIVAAKLYYDVNAGEFVLSSGIRDADHKQMILDAAKALLVDNPKQSQNTSVKKTSQLWEPCRCGNEPVYTPLHVCDKCWPTTT